MAKKTLYIIGIAGQLCAIVTWIEYFAIQFLYPNSGGPLPYIEFAPQAIVLFIINLLFSIYIVCSQLRANMKLLFLVLPVSFIIYRIYEVL